MKRRRIILAGSAVVAVVALATWMRRAAVPLASPPQRELGQPLAARSQPLSEVPDAGGAVSVTRDGSDVLELELAPEALLMQRARDALPRGPARTLALIETADRRFGRLHEARRLLEIEALVRLQKIGLSHSRAEHFYQTFPDSPRAREVERLTGYHPRPRGP